MNRNIVYPGSIPLDTDILSIQSNAMIALGYALRATLGTTVAADGLTCSPTSPASMQVLIGPGSLTSFTVIENSAFGSLPADTTDPLMKMGINTSAITLAAITPPATSGQSQVFLVQAQFSEADNTAVVLPYYNAANPAIPYSGPSNSGTAQNTRRAQTVSIQLKAGTPATTGSQVAPTADTGWFPLQTITVANGATSITSGNIATALGSPFISGNDGLGIRLGRILRVPTTLSTVGSGLYIPTPGSRYLRLRGVGPGAGGAASAACTSGEASAAPGGQAGAYGEVWIPIGSATSFAYNVTAGGAGGIVGGANGQSGTAATFGAFSFPSGLGGINAANPSSPELAAAQFGVSLVTGSGGTIVLTKIGGPGNYGNVLNIASYSAISGRGGDSEFGPGAPGVGETSPGGAGASPGSGGSGGSTAPSGAGQNGGAGAPAFFIVEDYS